MRRIYVIVNSKRKPGADKILNELLPWLRSVATIIKVDRDGNQPLTHVKADLALVFGGDGSILAAARRLRDNTIPVLGVNMGKLGFLAETSPTDLKQTLPCVLQGNYILSPRMMLKICVMDGVVGRRKNKSVEFFALNDAVLLRQPKAAMLNVAVRVSGEEIASYKGDGLIISTATGSTGYNLAAGGPILSERLKAMIVTPICPHTLANRPIVLSGEESIDINAETLSHVPIDLVIDGQENCSLISGAVARITKAPFECKLVTIGRKGRYEIIRDKLHWAGWIKER